jgi:hypothetical protein
MKKALIEQLTNKVIQAENIGDHFEVHPNLMWIDCPDEVEAAWDYDPDTNTFSDPHAHTKDEFGRPREPWIMQRMRSYPPIGDQLDMIHKEIAANGTISKDGVWFNTLLQVKNSTPKPSNFNPSSPEDIYNYFPDTPDSGNTGP